MARTTSSALLALCLVVVAGSFAQAAGVARVESEASFANHKHSPAFLGFMQRHSKNYCGDKATACTVSVLRCARDAYFSNGGGNGQASA